MGRDIRPAGSPRVTAGADAGGSADVARARRAVARQRTGLSLSTPGATSSAPFPRSWSRPPRSLEDGVYDDPSREPCVGVRGRAEARLRRGSGSLIEGYCSTRATWPRWRSTRRASLRQRRASGRHRLAPPLGVPCPSSPPHRRRLPGPRAGWEYTRHRSNDAFYRTTSHAVRVGFSAASPAGRTP